ncbi:MAG: FtsX-like permease family protein [Anaerolineaceae bacterium]|nr:MAG: FtsX-like permease family protein [Anaerolineaceae bacterium]
MKLRKIFRSAWEGLMLNKIRSFLTTLGVIIGVASVIVMLAVSAGAEAAIADQINALGANLIIVSPMRGVPGASRTLLLEDAYAIEEQVVGITGVSAEQSPAPQNIRAGGVDLEAIALIGTTADFPDVRDYAVAEGRYFTADEDDRKAKLVVLGAGIATDLFGAESALGQTITVGTTKLTVIGVMESKGIVSDVDYDGRIYLPLNLVLQKYMPVSTMRADAVRTIYLKAESQEQIPSIIAQTTALLAERHDVDAAKPDFTVQTQQDIIATQEATTAAFRDLLAWVAGVSLLVGGIGIMNIMLVSVTERTREIGLRQALGARQSNVLMQFLIEAIILSLVGGLVGVFIGVGGSYLFGSLGTMRTEIVPLSIPIAFGAAAVIGIFFGYYPATQAAKLDPIEALRRE